MCGILGVYGRVQYSENEIKRSLYHQLNRGPDNLSVLFGHDFCAGHVRLSIHDLSNAGSQPMFCREGRYCLIFNGEIYNFRELKEKYFCGREFNSDTDTEVLLYLLIELGFEKTLSLIDGMYAFSFHDTYSGDVCVARDHFGEKPLYYLIERESLIVSSSLFSIIELVGLRGINKQALSNYLHYGYNKGNITLADGIFKLMPGQCIKYNLNLNNMDVFHVNISLANENNGDLDDLDDLDELIRKSVISRLDADVPVGCFLSGGIDSSLIASYISETDIPVKAYTVGFHDKRYDESNTAQQIAQQLGIEIKTLMLGKDDILTLIDETQTIFDEPFADASYLATYAVSKFAREDVRVCLSGDAGDELFSGYNRHVQLPKIYNRLRYIPYFLRKTVSNILTRSTFMKSVIGSVYCSLMGSDINALSEKIDKLAIIISFKDKNDLLFKTLAGRDYSSELSLPHPFKEQVNALTFRELSELDFNSFMHEDVLTKVDRCTMAASIEARVPLLCSRIVRYARESNDKVHVDRGVQKFALRRVLSKRLPKEITGKPKSGFSVPYKELVDTHFRDRFSSFQIELMDRFEPSVLEPLFSFVENYYEGKNTDYKLVWNIYFYFVWMSNIKRITGD